MAKVKVVTFNAGQLVVQAFRQKIFEFTPFNEERFKFLINELQGIDADVLCLQEIYDFRQKTELASKLKPWYPYSLAVLESKNKALSSGLIILSRYPLIDGKFEKFESVLFEELLFSNFGYLKAKIYINKQPVWLYNIHLTAGGLSGPQSARAHRVRSDQIFEVLKNSREKLAIFAGDWNCGPTVSTCNFGELRESFCRWDGLTEMTWDPKNPLNQRSPHKSCPPQKIDHIFASKEFSIVSAKRLFDQPVVPTSCGLQTVSDHYGVEVHLTCNSVVLDSKKTQSVQKIRISSQSF